MKRRLLLRTYSTSWRANKHVFIRLISDRVDQTLHAIECFVSFKGPLAEAIHLGNGNKLSSLSESSYFTSRY